MNVGVDAPVFPISIALSVPMAAQSLSTISTPSTKPFSGPNLRRSVKDAAARYVPGYLDRSVLNQISLGNRSAVAFWRKFQAVCVSRVSISSLKFRAAYNWTHVSAIDVNSIDPTYDTVPVPSAYPKLGVVPPSTDAPAMPA